VNGSFVTSTSITLNWNSVATASSYDIYLGTTTIPATVIASSVTGTSYTYTSPATPNTTYYWYALPKNQSPPDVPAPYSPFTYIVITAPSSLGYYVVGYRQTMTAFRYTDVKFRMTICYSSVNGSGLYGTCFWNHTGGCGAAWGQ
jgi:hypothetical protein